MTQADIIGRLRAALGSMTYAELATQVRRSGAWATRLFGDGDPVLRMDDYLNICRALKLRPAEVLADRVPAEELQWLRLWRQMSPLAQYVAMGVAQSVAERMPAAMAGDDARDSRRDSRDLDTADEYEDEDEDEVPFWPSPKRGGGQRVD